MINRWFITYACIHVSLDQLARGLERAAPGYTPAHWWEAPWWLLVPSAAVWVWVATKVWKGEVR